MAPKKKVEAETPHQAPASPLSTIEQSSQVFVTKTFKEDSESAEEVIAVHRFITEPAKVEFRVGITVNLGNFESARVDVGVMIPTYREEVEAATEFAKQFVTARLVAEVEEIKSSNKKKSGGATTFMADSKKPDDEDPF